ncbi:MAG: hypothetical protein Q8R92_06285 [Deltaproteobacteria bacterium]|nr:hypothetical protein [Deltaproteobacteria bacterium]
MTRRRPDNRADDALNSTRLSWACLREKHVRARAVWPRNDTEQRWAREGSVPDGELESLRPANENHGTGEVPFG